MQNAFPDVKGLINNLHDIGFKGVWMVDPGLKVEKGYEAYDTGSAEDVWIQNADGKPYVGRSFHPLQKKKSSLTNYCGLALQGSVLEVVIN